MHSLAIAVKDADGRYRQVDAGFERCFGVSADRVTGRLDAECFEGEVLAWLQGLTRERRQPPEAATPALARAASSGLQLAHGTRLLAGQVLSLADPLAAHLSVLQFADPTAGTSDPELTLMAHDLRTPLNAMVGWVHLLEMGVTGDARDRAMAGLQRAIEEQRLLVEALSRLGRGLPRG